MLMKLEGQFPTHLKDQVKKYIEFSKRKNTKRAYITDWNIFVDWCNQFQHSYLPSHPDVLCMYISHLATNGYKYSSIKRKLSSISEAHKSAKYPTPTHDHQLHLVLRGIGESQGKKQTSKKAIILNDLQRIINRIDAYTLTGKRDKALLLLGFSLASRRSELVSISVEDIDINEYGMDVTFNRTKTSVEGEVKSVVYAHSVYCPIKALEDWLNAAGITKGAVFRGIDMHGNISNNRLTDKSVANIVKKYVRLAGFDPALYAGHSLRSGLATSAAMEGLNDASIMKQTGHHTRAMVDRYVQAGQRYQNNASSILRRL